VGDGEEVEGFGGGDWAVAKVEFVGGCGGEEEEEEEEEGGDQEGGEEHFEARTTRTTRTSFSVASI